MKWFSLYVFSIGVLLLSGTLPVFAHDSELQQRFSFLHAHESITGHAHGAWNSTYYSEGRDALDGESIIDGSFELAYDHVIAGFWYGQSPDEAYQEWQASLGLVRSWKNIEFYGAYTFVRNETDSADDHELGAGFTLSELPLDIELSADFAYSKEAQGYFVEIAFSRKVFLSERLTILYSVPFGINKGLVSEGHDGMNHVAARVGLDYSIFSSLSLVAQATQSFALKRDEFLEGDALLKDLFYVGAGVEWSF